jgi:hypothetical protein
VKKGKRDWKAQILKLKMGFPKTKRPPFLVGGDYGEVTLAAGGGKKKKG